VAGIVLEAGIRLEFPLGAIGIAVLLSRYLYGTSQGEDGPNANMAATIAAMFTGLSSIPAALARNWFRVRTGWS